MELSFSKALRQGLKNNSRILKEERKIDALKRRIKESEIENDWQWEASLEGRAISDNTQTTSRKKFATLEGERSYKQGLKIEPELAIEEEELLEQGLSKESLDFDIEFEQPLYPAAQEVRTDSQELGLKLKRAKAKLKELKNKLSIAWLKDYLELIELKLECTINNEEFNLAAKILERTKDQKGGHQGRKEILEAKIDLNEARQDLEESKNDYQKSVRDLSYSLGLAKGDKLEVLMTQECNLDWLAELEEELANLDNSAKLLVQAKANSQELLINELEREEVKVEARAKESKREPQVSLTASYDKGDKWQIALGLTHKLFNQEADDLAREEFEDELEALKEEREEHLEELKGGIDDLVGEITVNQLEVKEKKLRLEEAVIDLEEMEKEKAAGAVSDLEFEAEELNLKKAELALKEKEHQLLLSKYELVKLLGGLEF